MRTAQDKGNRRARLSIFGKFSLLLFFIAPVLFSVANSSAASQQETVLIVSSKTTGPYALLINEIKTRHNNPKVALKVIAADRFDKSLLQNRNRRLRLIVTVGTTAARKIYDSGTTLPVLNTLIPRTTYHLLYNNGRPGSIAKHSAIYIDQPISRQIRLIRTALPKYKRVGVILGPNSRKYRNDVRLASKANGASLYLAEVDDEKRLVSTLNRLLDSIDILLALPDKHVFNRRTARNILLLTYRQRIPMVGFSKAYVDAGALLAVYSTPQQFGRQVAEVIQRTAQKKQWQLPTPQFPRYFSVAVNRQVAASLGIFVETEAVLKKKLAPGGR